MKIVFKDESEFTTLRISTLDTITVCAKDYNDIKSLQDSLYTENNLNEIVVYSNDEDHEVYYDMVLLESPLFKIDRNFKNENRRKT